MDEDLSQDENAARNWNGQQQQVTAVSCEGFATPKL